MRGFANRSSHSNTRARLGYLPGFETSGDWVTG